MDDTASVDAQTSWPGEREPSRDDVQQANEVPDSAYLLNFKNALMASNDAKLMKRSKHETIPTHGTWTNIPRQTEIMMVTEQPASFTYPMSVLNEFPDLLPTDEVEAGRANFFQTFRRHVFVESLPLPSAPNAVMPPSLRYAFACLGGAQQSVLVAGSADDRQSQVSRGMEVARQLFYAGAELDVLMIESDNRHARSISTVLALVLRATYGSMTSDGQMWSVSAADFGYAFTMVRRLRIGDNNIEDAATSHLPNIKVKASLMSYLLLADTVRALHCGGMPLLSSTELDIAMPGSSIVQFPATYSLLFQPSAAVPVDLTSSDDAIILLLAILSDYLSIQSSLGLLISPAITTGGAPMVKSGHAHYINPFIPFSPITELSRIKDNLRVALSRWRNSFSDRCSEDVTALYLYCRLVIECPQIWHLPGLAGYPPHITAMGGPAEKSDGTFIITNEALRLAWLVIESIDLEKATLRSRMSIWLPVIVFHAALVVWQKLRSTESRTHGSLRVLNIFEKELTKMPWPCTLQMVETLQKLITQSN